MYIITCIHREKACKYINWCPISCGNSETGGKSYVAFTNQNISELGSLLKKKVFHYCKSTGCFFMYLPIYNKFNLPYSLFMTMAFCSLFFLHKILLWILSQRFSVTVRYNTIFFLTKKRGTASSVALNAPFWQE